MLYLQGALNANSRFIIEGWKSQVSNAENPGSAKNGAKPEKPKPTQLRETRDSATETGPKLDVENPFFRIKLPLWFIIWRKHFIKCHNMHCLRTFGYLRQWYGIPR